MMTYETLYEAKFAARYAARLHERSARVWGRVAGMINFLEILGGSGALAAYFAQAQHVAAAVSLVLAACVALNHTLEPVRNQVQEEYLKKAFMSLLAKSHNADLDQFNDDLAQLCAEDGKSFEALRMPAYNDVAKEYGREDHVDTLRWPERVIGLLG